MGKEKRPGVWAHVNRFFHDQDAARGEIESRVHEVTKRVSEAAGSASELAKGYLNARTSLLCCDSIERLKDSDNPLIRLERQKLPHHVTSSFIYAVSAAGIFLNADEVTRFTGAVMDHDQAVVQQFLRRVFTPEEAREISLWMDTAPSSEIAGGWGHRIFHGHDLDAMVTLIQEHGHTGAAEWANHVWLRDFWTPHGVPYLPTGSGDVYEWLLDMGVSPSTAISLLTVNAAELASGFLAFYSYRRMLRGIDSYRKARSYRNALKEIDRLIAEDSDEDALRLVDETEAFSETEPAPHLRLDLAMVCLGHSLKQRGERSAKWGTRAFAIASDLCRASSKLPREIPYGETRVSFHGVAATVMAAAYSSHVQQVKADWSYLSTRLEFGIKRFLEVSRAQSEPSRIQVQGKPVWGYRPFSALTNQLLALELALAYGGLKSTILDPITIRRRIEELLCELKGTDDAGASLAGGILVHLRRVYPLNS